MGLRRDGRETAVQFLFSKDIKNDSHSEDLDNFFSISTAKKGAKKFALELVNGIIEKIKLLGMHFRLEKNIWRKLSNL